MGAEGQDKAEAVGKMKRMVSGSKMKRTASGAKTREELDIEIPEGDAKKGEKLFKSKCKQCHHVDPKAGSKQG